MLTKLMVWLTSEDGQGMVEYGLIIALVAVAVIAVLGTLGEGLNAMFTDLVERLGF